MVNQYKVLLYYHFIHIEEPDTIKEEHLNVCKDLGLLGRIYLSSEGINGTVSGTVEQIQRYKTYLNTHPLFKGIVFKEDFIMSHVFKKMHVRVKNELVNFSLDVEVNPLEITGDYIKPTEFYEGLINEDTIVIDARNHYDYNLGHFRGAINPNIKNFRDLPNWVKENKALLKDKRILTYCTGGVRCEKFTGWLKKEGFNNVGQLQGGIVTYGKHPETLGKLWDGKCYVFDERIGIPINQLEHVVVGKDHFTGEPCERYINCSNPDCNKQILCSEENEHKYLGACSDECRTHPRNRYIEKMKLKIN
ncbi:rhodanese-related sulfurtransferase [Liberiplasma polymorphum]|uniref:oxygen-dependent tRNA uridine(34) hydroxylase TrhO n=1 Tax=Liberiplasma polymorphum TaxID=3374570 RepID=UPI003773B1FE